MLLSAPSYLTPSSIVFSESRRYSEHTFDSYSVEIHLHFSHFDFAYITVIVAAPELPQDDLVLVAEEYMKEVSSWLAIQSGFSATEKRFEVTFFLNGIRRSINRLQGIESLERLVKIEH